MKRYFHIHFTLLLAAILPLSADCDVRDMYIEVVYQDYHCIFSIKDSHVSYEDDFHILTYYPETESGENVIKYWQQDMRKLLRKQDYSNIPAYRIIKYRTNESADWSCTDSEKTKGEILLSLLSRVQRFPVEEKIFLEADNSNRGGGFE